MNKLYQASKRAPVQDPIKTIPAEVKQQPGWNTNYKKFHGVEPSETGSVFAANTQKFFGDDGKVSPTPNVL